MLNIWYSGRTGWFMGKIICKQTFSHSYINYWNVKRVKCYCVFTKNHIMLNGDNNENSKKLIGFSSKTTTLICTCSIITFFYISLPLLHVLWRKCRMCSLIIFFLIVFFLHCCSFSPYWSLAFLIFSPPLHKFHVVNSFNEIRLLFFISYLVLPLSLLSASM